MRNCRLLCLVLRICPYGMDPLLFFTHVLFFAATTFNSVWYATAYQRTVAMRVKSGYRILWFASVKAVLNTAMVVSGFKPRGHFKARRRCCSMRLGCLHISMLHKISFAEWHALEPAQSTFVRASTAFIRQNHVPHAQCNNRTGGHRNKIDMVE